MNKIIVSILLLLLVVLGILWFLSYQSNTDQIDNDEDTTSLELNKDFSLDNQDKNLSFEYIINQAPTIVLADVAETGAEGVASLAVVNNKTYHQVVAQNMPVLTGGDFYEGWLVKDPASGQFFSTGEMIYDADTKQADLNFVIDGDKSDYRFVVITLEPNDGDPAPAKHIIEERFGDNVDFSLNL
ncbi:MAG: anti-sigma factor [Candidatus Paceibacterota bacterium]